MDQLGLEGGGPCASSSAESVEGAVELNCCRQAAIQYTSHRLPQHIHKVYLMEVPVPLWYKDDSLHGSLLSEVLPMAMVIYLEFIITPHSMA